MTDRSIRVKLTKTVGPNQYPERGLFTVTPDEARLLVRGVVLEMVRERLVGMEGTPPREQVLDEALNVLADIQDDIEQLYDDGED